jgi:ABC-type transport system involved in multi-copper enzyme maturation permease subunit
MSPILLNLKQRVREDLLSGKTGAVAAVTALLLGASAALQVADFDRRQRLYTANVREQPELAEVFRRPEALSVFVRGVDAEVYGGRSVAGISLERAPAAAYENPLLALFPTPDLRFVVQYVLSLFALAMAFDIVAGLKERGTLALILANPVSRNSLLVGRSLGSFLGLTTAFVLGFLPAVVVVAWAGVVPLDAATGARLGALAAVSILYLAVFFALGVAVSTLTTSSAQAFLGALLAWAVLVLVLPHALVLLAGHRRPIRPPEMVAAEKNAARNQVLAAERAFLTEWPRANRATEAIDEAYAHEVDDQQRLMRVGSRLSPVGSYALAAAQIAGTSAEAAEAYVGGVRSYLSRVRRWFYVERQVDPQAPEPPFLQERVRPAEAVARAAPEAALLAGWLAALGLIAVWRFQRYDVR